MSSLISDHVVINAFAWTTSATFGGHYVYDLILEWGGYGDHDGHFNSPSNIAVDSLGNVYVADTLNSRIQKFNSTGAFITKWGSHGSGDGQFGGSTGVWGPAGIAVDKDGYVYVVDPGGNRIQKFDSNGVFITKWVVQAWWQNALAFPDKVAVDSSGYVYVLDDLDHVQKFTSNGTFVTKWGHTGAEDGEFSGTQDITVDPVSGYVYVADGPTMPLQGGVARIQKFTLSGEFVAKWLLPDYRITGIHSIAIGPTGNVYASDNTCDRSQFPSFWDVVEEFTPDGTFIAKIDIAKLADRESAPVVTTSDIAVDSDSNLYVLESTISSLKGPVLKFGLVLRHPPNAPTSPAWGCNVIGCSNGATPFFSWKFSDPDPGDAMAAWEIQISTGPDGTGAVVWDSGKQYRDNSSVFYNGNPAFFYSGSYQLSQGVTYHWRVKTWDNYDLEGSYCADQTFMLGSATTTLISTSTSTSTLSTSTSTGTTSAITTTQTLMSTIRGTVYWYDSYGNLHPLPWAQIVAVSQEDTTIVTSSFTDGTYVTYVNPGTYNVTASSDPAFKSQSKVITALPSAVTVVDFQLQPTGCPLGGTCTATTTLTQGTTTLTQGTTTLSTTPTQTTAGLQMQVLSNSTVSGLAFDSTRGLLNFTVSGPQGTYGFFDATVAKTLLSGQPVVLIDGVQRSATVSGDTNFWYIHVTYPHSQHQVTIGGSNTVPEFPSVALLAIVLLLVLIAFRRKPGQ